MKLIKRGAKLQQARLIGASDDVNKRRGALAPAAGSRPRRASVGDLNPPPTDVWNPPPIKAGDIDVCYKSINKQICSISNQSSLMMLLFLVIAETGKCLVIITMTVLRIIP